MPEEKYDKMYLLNTYPSCVCGTASTLGTHTLAFKQLTAFALQSHARRGTGAEPRVPVPDAGARGDPSSGLGIGAKPGHPPLLVPHTALQRCPWWHCSGAVSLVAPLCSGVLGSLSCTPVALRTRVPRTKPFLQLEPKPSGQRAPTSILQIRFFKQ